ncbi:MAG: dihydrolipoamide acetyltransferase family protein, partial [Dehalococcoidia bacterium]|nr:dihydrolipoamide acetyltransferase family protein [Dehalococcoidia bacterium]
EVVMPQMGADMDEGTIVQWLKNEGDQVERGEIIAEIETDKANVEIEAFESGTFRKALASEGDTVAVGTVIAIVAAPEDDISKYEGAAVSKAATAKGAPAKGKAEAPVPAREAEQKEEAAAKARPEAEAKAKETPARPTDGRVRASPVARKLADEKGVDLSQVRGTGPGGRIVQRDVQAAVEQREEAQPAPPAEARPAGVEAIQMSRMRQTIARRMAQSKREAPHYYVTVDIDMTEAERLRHQINDAYHRQFHLTVNDFVVKASAIALARHPIFNSWFVDGEIRQHEAINVCISIALDEGLIAPAILDCGRKSLIEISNAGRDLVKRARSGALKPEEYSGGTFTVTTPAMYDVEALIAIIQPPQTAILARGAVREAPVVRDGELAVGRVMKAVLSADHRVTDGALGARFLNEIRRLLENPAGLLVTPPEDDSDSR